MMQEGKGYKKVQGKKKTKDRNIGDKNKNIHTCCPDNRAARFEWKKGCTDRHTCLL